MKKYLMLLCVLLYACSSTKNIKSEDDAEVFEQHARPFTIFGVGSYGKKYMILILTDAKGEYFTVKVPVNTTLKKGLTYVSYASE